MVLSGIFPYSVLLLYHPGSKSKNGMKIHLIFPKLGYFFLVCVYDVLREHICMYVSDFC